MFKQPIFERLENDSHNILLAGCGGGYDILAGLPLFYELHKLGKTVHLANLSFVRDVSSFAAVGSCRVVNSICFETRYSDFLKAGKQRSFDESLGYPRNYYPEFHVSKHIYDSLSLDIPVYAFGKRGKKGGRPTRPPL